MQNGFKHEANFATHPVGTCSFNPSDLILYVKNKIIFIELIFTVSNEIMGKIYIYIFLQVVHES